MHDKEFIDGYYLMAKYAEGEKIDPGFWSQIGGAFADVGTSVKKNMSDAWKSTKGAVKDSWSGSKEQAKALKQFILDNPEMAAALAGGAVGGVAGQRLTKDKSVGDQTWATAGGMGAGAATSAALVALIKKLSGGDDGSAT